MTCPHCGHEVQGNATHCPACSSDIRVVERRAARPTLRDVIVSVADAESPRGLNRLVFWGLLLVGLTGVGVVVALFLLPPEHLLIPDIQPVVSVAPELEFRVGTSRVVTWGDRVIIVVRRTDDRYAALQGTAPGDGCFLQWDREALHLTSPCTHAVFDLRGNVISGLTTESLRHYAVFVRDGVVYVTES
ncbi:MAG TPA: hypothetical protein VGA37_10120 [Gemmatimonadales bacterium]